MLTFDLTKSEARGPMIAGHIRHPQVAEVVLDGRLFVAEDEPDWQRTIQVALLGAPTTKAEAYWCAAAREMLKLCQCYCCERNHLDPDSDGASLGLCAACLEQSERENMIADGYDVPDQPDPPEVARCTSCGANVGEEVNDGTD